MKNALVDRRLANYLRTHRRNVGLTQRELGHILGYSGDFIVSKHERFRVTVPLVRALGYETVFRVPVSEIFAGLRDEVEEEIERKLIELEDYWGQQSATGRNANATARKLTWLYERRNVEADSTR
jgi:DNA-binding XRE family transcriptional regulator